MSNDPKRDRALEREQRIQMANRPRIQRETFTEIEALLIAARTEIIGRLATASGFDAFRLPLLRNEIDRLLIELGNDSGAAVAAGVTTAWVAGQTAVDVSLAAGGVEIAPLLVSPDMAQLEAMRDFATDKMRGISLSQIDKVNTALGMVIIGAHSVDDGIRQVQAILGDFRHRASAVVQTEVGRAFSVAHQLRQEQAAALLPGLKKQWRRSGKTFFRWWHAAIDGQIRDIKDPFKLADGSTILHPRHPAGSPRNTIRCGCVSLSWMDSWEMRFPGVRPPDEMEMERLRRVGRVL